MKFTLIILTIGTSKISKYIVIAGYIL